MIKRIFIICTLPFLTGITFAGENLFSKETHPQEWCMAQNLYHEARGSSLADQAAVADVVLNRVKDIRYPNTVCEVVKQGSMSGKSKGCQFSWYCDGKSDKATNKTAWLKAQELAYKVMNHDMYIGITEGSTHYHADYVKPSWAKSLTLTGQIGDHIYYRWN
jgi:spore germination cell wall hydrolase CwlJ-like protein